MHLFKGNILKSWGKITKLGPYDIIIVDPPSFQKGSFVAIKDYGKIVKRLPGLMRSKESRALLCLNAPELSADFLISKVKEAAPQLRFVRRLENPASFVDVSPERSLKVLIYACDFEDLT